MIPSKGSAARACLGATIANHDALDLVGVSVVPRVDVVGKAPLLRSEGIELRIGSPNSAWASAVLEPSKRIAGESYNRVIDDRRIQELRSGGIA